MHMCLSFLAALKTYISDHKMFDQRISHKTKNLTKVSRALMLKFFQTYNTFAILPRAIESVS